MANGTSKISTWSASVHLLKAVMGAGSFALPWAFLQAGAVLGPVLLVLAPAMKMYNDWQKASPTRHARALAHFRTVFIIVYEQARILALMCINFSTVSPTRRPRSVLVAWTRGSCAYDD